MNRRDELLETATRILAAMASATELYTPYFDKDVSGFPEHERRHNLGIQIYAKYAIDLAVQLITRVDERMRDAPAPVDAGILDTPISDLRLSPVTYNAVATYFTIVNDMVRWTAKDLESLGLFQVPHRQALVREIESKLAAFGLKLGMTEEECDVLHPQRPTTKDNHESEASRERETT